MSKVQIYIDADACPVKDEVYRVAERLQLKVYVVANSLIRVPFSPLIQMEVVPGGFDAADDWIAERVAPSDLVITSDILLAERCVVKGARVLGPKGEEFTEDNIGSAVAMRELMQDLRHQGEVRGGPAPMTKKDRSNFLNKIDPILQDLIRKNKA